MRRCAHHFAAISLAALVSFGATSAGAKPHENDDDWYRAVPEIDAKGASVAAAVLLAGAAIVLGRRLRQKS